LYEGGVTVATFTQGFIDLVLNADNNIRYAFQGQLPTASEALRAPLQNHLMTIFIALLYAFLIYSLVTSGRMGASAMREEANAALAADRRIVEEDRQEVRVLIETSQQQAAQAASRQFLITFVSLNPAQQQAVISAGIQNGSITPDFAQYLQVGLQQITNGPSGLDILAAAAENSDPLGGGKKKKQSKRAKSQKGGAPHDVFLSYDSFFKFIDIAVPDTLKSDIINGINFALDLIDMELYVAYRFAQDDRNKDLLEILTGYMEPGAPGPAAAAPLFSSGVSSSLKEFAPDSPSGAQFANWSQHPVNMDMEMEMVGGSYRSRQSRMQRQARRSRKGGKKGGRQRQRQTKRQRRSRKHRSARRA
jgi:hypothetical protein